MKIECRKAGHYNLFYFMEHFGDCSARKLNAERMLCGKPCE